MHLSSVDSEIYELIEQEKIRQTYMLNLIASENYTHSAVREAMGSILTNKYAEGYPGKRYYSGCAFVDNIEIIAQERCKALFSAEYVNVQPHSGSSANMAVYTALLKPNDTIMGMSLSAGGHLTHGHSVNFSGSLYNSIQYGVDPVTEQLNYDDIEQLAYRHKPKLLIAGSSAYSRIIDFDKLAQIAKNIDAYFMADIAHIAGFIAVGLYPSPLTCADIVTSTTHKTLRGPRGGIIMSKLDYKDQIDRAIMPGIQGGPLMHVIAAKAVGFKLALQQDFKLYQEQILANSTAMAKVFQDLGYRIVSGGTDTHLFILDLTEKSISGLAAERLLESAGILVSRSAIPFDKKKPWITSGIRLGTPALTTQGFTIKQIQRVAYFIDELLSSDMSEDKIKKIKTKIQKFLLTIY